MYLILACVGLVVLVYLCLIRPHTYWTKRGIPEKSIFDQICFLFDFVLQLKPQPDLMKKEYDAFPNERYFGCYQMFSPILQLRDPELIKQVTVKDFDHFVDHRQFIPEEFEPLWGKNLLGLKGEKWRDMRATLSPSFTSSKMKSMFTLINDCALQFVDFFKNDQTIKVVEMKDALTRFTNDVIATTAFGVTCNSLTDRDNEFYVRGKEATNLSGFWNNLKLFILLVSPKAAKLLRITMFSKRVSEFFRRLVKTNIASREEKGIVRHDMIHLLMEAKKGRLRHEDKGEDVDIGFAVIEESSIGKEERRQKQQLTDDDLTAQALIFFFAGFENVSTLMCFILYELIINPEIQSTLRKEIRETFKKCDGSVTYEALLNMKYMDMVVSETLRKWPLSHGTDRVCVKPYTIHPTRTNEKPIQLQEGDIIWLPIYGIHRDPQYYPDPDRFDPDRFSDENKNNIDPYTFLTFGVGPRSCIGTRFALLETKTILFHMLANFEVCVSEKTTIPLKLAKDNFNLASANGFWFSLNPLNV